MVRLVVIAVLAVVACVNANDADTVNIDNRPAVIVDVDGSQSVALDVIAMLTAEYFKAKHEGNEKRAKYLLSWIKVQRQILASYEK